MSRTLRYPTLNAFSKGAMAKMKAVRVLIVEEHALIRAGLRVLVNKIKGFEVIAETGDCHEVPRLLMDKRPDIVLMGVAMPELKGLEVAERVTKEFPQVYVIVLSMHRTEEYVLQAFRAGAKGYLSRNTGPEELEKALISVAQGKTHLCSTISMQVIEDFIETASGKPKKVSPELEIFAKLTPRQLEILKFIAEGYTTKQIASTLNIAVKTVDVQRTNLMERLDIHNIAGLVKYASRNGLVKTDPLAGTFRVSSSHFV